jgi:hypothetical protein
MKRGTALLMTATVAVFFSFSQEIQGGEKGGGNDTGAREIAIGLQTGFRTDRLSTRQLRIWKRIEAIASARDADGRSLHPALENLWRQVEWSGHAIYIEMRTSAIQNMAGKFMVEKINPDGKNHTLSIYLYISTIDKADTSEWARRADGFIPFEKLEREKRYAEVLGHELEHAIRTIQDPEYAALSEEQDRLEAEFNKMSHKGGKVIFNGESKLRRQKLDSLAKLIEAPANAVEIEVWRELAKNSEKN